MRTHEQGNPPPLRILVVDDEQAVRFVLCSLLEAQGHNVEACANGFEGLERFHSESFDMVLTDRAMPGMTGDELAVAIKRAAPRTPVILVTGFAPDANEELPGIDAVVRKPFTMSTLSEAIDGLRPANLAP
jgi:CheY-like chemotaxis protein